MRLLGSEQNASRTAGCLEENRHGDPLQRKRLPISANDSASDPLQSTGRQKPRMELTEPRGKGAPPNVHPTGTATGRQKAHHAWPRAVPIGGGTDDRFRNIETGYRLHIFLTDPGYQLTNDTVYRRRTNYELITNQR